jgi:hypothetical protein
MQWNWARLPAPIDRTLWDHLKWGCAGLLGVALGYLIFGLDDPGLLRGYVIGVAIVILVFTLARRASPRRRKT